MPDAEREGFSGCCSIFNYHSEKRYVNIMKSKIRKGNLDFSYAGFFNINLQLVYLNILQGNLVFDSARFYYSEISTGMVDCGGNRFFTSEISFRYIKADTVKIEIIMASKKLSLDFLCAETDNSTIQIDPLPTAVNELCLCKTKIDRVVITNAEIDSLDISKANIDYLEFKRCKFLGPSEIAGDIKELHIDDCLNSKVFKLSVPKIESITLSNTLNSGKFCVKDFVPIVKAISKQFAISTFDVDQLLMLKENFRQTGEYANEDICHLCLHRLKTKREKNPLKKMGRLTLDGISGYGTKPLRMLMVILMSILFFGTLYYLVPSLSYHGVRTWIEHVYASGITFFAVGYGDLYPLNIVTKMVSLAEAFLGVTATSYFLVLLSRKVNR